MKLIFENQHTNQNSFDVSIDVKTSFFRVSVTFGTTNFLMKKLSFPSLLSYFFSVDTIVTLDDELDIIFGNVDIFVDQARIKQTLVIALSIQK